MSQWVWEQADWPEFSWQDSEIRDHLAQARLIQGKLLALMSIYQDGLGQQLISHVLANEMTTTSEIEGEILNRDSVRSSIAKRLGINHGGLEGPPNRYVEGLLDLLLDAVEHHDEPLSLERLFGWHAALFPTGYSGIQKIHVAGLRCEGTMEIVSGLPGKQKRHYVAPPWQQLPQEMQRFLQWFNQSLPMDGILRAAIAHLWFEMLHPFDDGNGRVGRAIIEMALAQDEQLNVRYYSFSRAVMRHRKGYYQQLGIASVGSLDITAWLIWFLQCFQDAIQQSLDDVQIITMKARFWQQHTHTELSVRQQKALNKMLDAGQKGFEGGMTTKKYSHLNKVSRATAYRELIDLVHKSCLRPMATKGRSSAYDINWSKKEA